MNTCIYLYDININIHTYKYIYTKTLDETLLDWYYFKCTLFVMRAYLIWIKSTY